MQMDKMFVLFIFDFLILLVVIFFAGHGFELYGQTYLQPIDSSDDCVLSECICSEYILQCLQEKKPALNVLLIDACRKLPANFR